MTSPFPLKAHDHQACIKSALAEAEAVCKERGVRLTAIRRRILEIVWRQHEPMGAYKILEILRTGNKKAEPPTVYRALEFLMENGLVHRIQSLNAFVGCRCPGEQHEGVFLICRQCGIAGELPAPAVDNAVSELADAHGFSLAGINLEAVGMCPDCQAGAQDNDNAR